jgi:hypothetical protein
VAAAPMLNVSQCVVSLSLAWLTVRTLPDVAMVPEPATTCPLVGKALPGSESANALAPCRAKDRQHDGGRDGMKAAVLRGMDGVDGAHEGLSFSKPVLETQPVAEDVCAYAG